MSLLKSKSITSFVSIPSSLSIELSVLFDTTKGILTIAFFGKLLVAIW